MTIEQLFFELIRVAIGTQDRLSRPPSAEEWKLLYDMAKKQSLVGICFAAVQRLSGVEDPINHKHLTINLQEMQYLTWMGMAAKIQQRNESVTRDVARVREHFEAQGMDMVLLKGQGNLCNYPENLRWLRTPGDIDAWVMPKGFGDMPVKERMKNDEWFLRWLWKKDKSIRHCYIHVVYPPITDTEVEVHFRPSYLNSPIRNKKFQRWMMEEAPRQIANVVQLPGHEEVEVAVPTWDFNVVYQLSHLYRHIFDDGLGLRQVMDYYWLLVNAPQVREDFTHLLKRFGMLNFAGAVMYVLREIFHMEDKYMICPVDEKRGRFLLDEMMLSGNFGHFDQRQRVKTNENGVSRFLRRQRRNMRFLGQYTEEVLCVPVYRIYQEWWRIKMDLKCK